LLYLIEETVVISLDKSKTFPELTRKTSKTL